MTHIVSVNLPTLFALIDITPNTHALITATQASVQIDGVLYVAERGVA